MKYAVINNQHCFVMDDDEVTILMKACAINGTGLALTGKYKPVADLWRIFTDPDSASYSLYTEIIYGKGLK